MVQDSLHAHEREQLARVDYFLDQLARAVERGEVPRASYETLAPRYLALRADLVAVLTGVHAGAGASASQPGVPAARPRVSVPQSAVSLAQPGVFPSQIAVPRPAVQPRRERKSVRWTTVLLFLGAFLVIVASAIFAFAVWNIATPAVKLAFLGALTVAFYAAGGYARTKLDLRAGSTALTVVGSAMLLFDCWIVIDGFNLQSIPAWTVALFVCSAVYWFTEVRLGERFYGVAGAAAQVGWWWLLGAGMHFEYPLRIAGIALVALLWQLTAERVEEASPFASLASVLKWAAPIVEAGAALALFVDLATIGAPDTRTLLAVVAAAVAGAIVVWRTRLALPSRPLIAALAQLPLAFACLLSAYRPGWMLVAVLGVMTAAYTLTSLLGAGEPFAILALVSEFALAGVICDLMNVDPHTTSVVFAALAVTWVVASRLAASLAERRKGDDVAPAAPGAYAFSRVAGYGGTALLALASVMSISAGSGIALAGVRLTATDAATSAGLLVAWAFATLAKRTQRDAILTSLWSLYVLAAVLAWAAPGVQSALYALALLVASAVWFSARSAMSRYYCVDAALFGWLQRGLIVLIVVGGLGAQEFYFGGDPAWTSAALVLAAALFFASDAAFEGPAVSAVAAGVAGTGAAFLAGHSFAFAHTPRTGALAALAASPVSFAAVAAAAGAALLSGAGALLRSWRARHAGRFAVAAASAGTGLAVFAFDEPARVATSFALLAFAWVAASAARRLQVLVGFGGLSAFVAVGAALAAADAPPWVTVATAAVACFVMNLPAFSRIAGPDGVCSRAGLALSAAGLAGIAGIAALGVPDSLAPGLIAQGGWLAFGLHGEAVLLAAVGATVIAQAIRWKAEPALYVGFGVLLLALWTETHALSLTTTELYSTPLALYLIAMGYLYARQVPGRGVPPVLDAGAVIVGLGMPLVGALSGWGPDAFAHTAWVIGLSLAFIGGGIVGRCRAYLFGGAGALAIVAAWRTTTYLAEFWWLVLGIIGIAMLVIALTWERQRMLLSETQQRLRESFEHWR